MGAPNYGVMDGTIMRSFLYFLILFFFFGGIMVVETSVLLTLVSWAIAAGVRLMQVAVFGLEEDEDEDEDDVII